MKANNLFKIAFLIIFIQVILCSWLDSQEQKTLPPLQLRMEVRLLQVEVYAKDDKGNFVPGLTKDDFVLKEDGKQQTIRYVDEIHREPAAPPKEEQPTAPIQAAAKPQQAVNSTALIFDGCNSSQMSMNHIKDAVKDFVSKNANKNNLMAIFLIDTQGNYQMQQGFTESPADLINTIDKLKTGTGGMDARAAKIKSIDGILEEMQRCKLAETPDTKEACAQSIVKLALNQAKNHALEEQRSTKNSIESLEAIFSFLHHTPGKKSVLYFSDGFDPSGSTYFYYLQESIMEWDLPQTGIYNLKNIISEAQQAISTNFAKASYFQNLINRANASGLTVYWLSPQNPDQLLGADTSLKPSVASSKTAAMALDQLKSLPDNTGGFTVSTGTNFDEYFAKLINNMSRYYLISYVPERPSHDGKLHNITVESIKPNVKVVARKALTDITMEDQVNNMLASALDFPDIYKQIPIEKEYTYVLDEKNKMSVLSSIGVPSESIVPIYEGAKILDQLHFAYLVKNKDGKIVLQDHKIMNIDLAGTEYNNLSKANSFFQNSYSFPLEPGTYTYYAAVVEVGGWKLTSWKTPLVISLKNDKCFTVNPLILASNVQIMEAPSNQAQQGSLRLEKDGTILYKDKKFAYSAVKNLPSTGQLMGLYQIYQASAKESSKVNLEISFKLFDDKDALLSSLPPTKITQYTDPGKKLITNFFILPYKNLFAKKYRLVLIVHDLGNECMVESPAYFNITQ